MKGLHTNKNTSDLQIQGEIDAKKYSELYDKYVSAIYRFVYFKVNVPELAEDITGETFLKTWQYLQEGRKINNIRAFFYRTAGNLVVDYYRNNAKSVVLLDKAEELVDNKFSSEIDKINLVSELAIIERTLKQINDTYREIIALYFIEQLSIAEIAEIKDKKEGAIRVLIHRALKSLKNKFPKDFIEAMQKFTPRVQTHSRPISIEANKMPVIIENVSVE